MQSFVTAKQALEVATQSGGLTSYPLVGITLTIIGTLLAVGLVPDDPEPQGALFFPAVVLALSLVIAPLATAISDPKTLLRGEHLLALAPVYWLLLDLLQSAYPMEGISQSEVIYVFLGIGLFVSSMWLSAYSRAWKLPSMVVESVAREFSPNVYFGICVVTFLLGFLRFAIPINFDLVEMFSYIGSSRWDAPWGRGQLGGWDAFLDHLQYFGYLMPALTVVIARSAGWVDVRTMIVGAMAILMTLLIAQSGSRRVIGVMIGMALILWVLSEKRLKVRHAIIGLVVVVLLLGSLQVMLEYRNVGLGAIVGNSETEVKMEHDYLHVDDNFFRFAQIVQIIPESHPYVYHKYFLWLVIRPIPRVLWSDKPVDPGFDLPAALGKEGVSLSSSAIGELYMSAGFIGIFIGGLFFGKLAQMASQLLVTAKTLGAYLVYGTFVMSLFVGMRSMLELVLFSYMILAWIGLSYLFMYLRNGKRA